MDDLTFEEWLAIGVRRSWVGAPVCYTHDGLPMTETEAEEFYEHEPCLHIMRCYEDDKHRQAVEADHAPSQWRRTNRGL